MVLLAFEWFVRTPLPDPPELHLGKERRKTKREGVANVAVLAEEVRGR